MGKPILILIILAMSVSVTYAQKAIANEPPTAFGPVKTIRYEAEGGSIINFSSDKTRVEVILPAIYRKEVYSFTPEGKLTNYDLYEGDGRPSGTRSIYTYDSKGRLSEVVHYLLGSFSYRENFSYSEDGQQVQIKRQFRFNQRPETEIDYHDKKGNIIKAIFYDFDGSLEDTEFYKYDERGNPTEFITYDEKGVLWFKAIYKYEFDSYRNWIKEEDRSWSADTGKLREEPKVTIKRSITYY